MIICGREKFSQPSEPGLVESTHTHNRREKRKKGSPKVVVASGRRKRKGNEKMGVRKSKE